MARLFAKAQMHRMGHGGGHGIKAQELFILVALWRSRNEAKDGAEVGANPSELAAKLGVTPGMVTQLLSSLEARGSVRREPDPQDRRKVLVRLTAEGLAAIEEAEAGHLERYRGLAERLGPADTERFIALLEKATEYFASSCGAASEGCPTGLREGGFSAHGRRH